jgi:hypothetical protein
MNKVFIIFLIIGFYSCGEKQESEKNSESVLIEKKLLELNSFGLIKDFEKHKAEFKSDTIRLTNDPANGSGLTIYHSKKFDYLVFDFMVYVEKGIQHNTYWTDKKLKFKFVEQSLLAYKKEDFLFRYLAYDNAQVVLFDNKKNEVTDIELTEKTKTELELFFKDKSEGINLIK